MYEIVKEWIKVFKKIVDSMGRVKASDQEVKEINKAFDKLPNEFNKAFLKT